MQGNEAVKDIAFPAVKCSHTVSDSRLEKCCECWTYDGVGEWISEGKKMSNLQKERLTNDVRYQE